MGDTDEIKILKYIVSTSELLIFHLELEHYEVVKRDCSLTLLCITMVICSLKR